jgi:hypothetical protein
MLYELEANPDGPPGRSTDAAPQDAAYYQRLMEFYDPAWDAPGPKI